MLKRFTKSGKKQNKSGVILITILFILAVAFILIGSALIMTANTRKRLYSFAEGSQARLTVTSAAQMFENALQTQQISDKQFKTLCDAGATVWFTDNTTGADPVPGMGGTGGPTGTAPDNCTCAKFGYDGTNPTVAFTTIIDDEVENVLLTYEGTPSTTHSSPFAFQAELGEGGRLDKVAVGNIYGTSSRYNADDNVVVSRGDGISPADSSDFYSTFITTKPMRSASGTHYHGDLVLAGDDAGFSMYGGGTGAGAMMYGGSVFFINCDHLVLGNPAATDTRDMIHDESAAKTSQIYLCGVTDSGISGSMERPYLNFSAGSIFYLDYDETNAVCVPRLNGSYGLGVNEVDPSCFASGTTGLRSSTTTNKDIYFYIGNLDQYLSTEYCAPGTTTPARPSSYTEFVNYAASEEGGGVSLNPNGVVPAGTPELPSAGTSTPGVYKVTSVGSNMYDINCGAGNIIIYLDGAINITDGGGFKVDGGTGASDSPRCYFILTRGSSISFQGNNQPTGFFSMNCHTISMTDPVLQTQAPCIYLIGAGTNHDADLEINGARKGQISCQVNQGNYLEAMVALYPYSDSENDPGSFCTNIGNSMHFYGRIIAKTIQNTNGAALGIPYCPQFSTSENTDKLYRVKSAWTLVSFDYYYDDSDPTGTSSGLHQ